MKNLALIAHDGKKAVLVSFIFLRDPLDKHPQEPDVQMLMRLCDVHSVPLATNPASARLFLAAM